MRAASGRATGERSDAVFWTAIAAPGAIARMQRRVGMLETLVIGPFRVADLG
jgi:hypothetical protein